MYDQPTYNKRMTAERILRQKNSKKIEEIFNQYHPLFNPDDSKTIKSILNNPRVDIDMYWFFKIFTIAYFTPLYRFTESYKPNNWVEFIGRINTPNRITLVRDFVKHNIDWNRIAIKITPIMNRQRTEEVGLSYIIKIGVALDHNLSITTLATIKFSKQFKGIIFLPKPFVDTLDLKKGNRFLFILYTQGKDMYDRTKRYDIEANPSLSSTDDDESEEIIYDWG